MDNRLPNLVNLNEDPQLSEMLLYMLKEGKIISIAHKAQLKYPMITPPYSPFNIQSGKVMHVSIQNIFRLRPVTVFRKRSALTDIYFYWSPRAAACIVLGVRFVLRQILFRYPITDRDWKYTGSLWLVLVCLSNP